MAFFDTARSIRRLLGLYSSTAGSIGVLASSGKPIKRKILTATAGPNSSTVDIAHGLTVTAVQVTRLDVILKKGSDSTVVKAPHISDTEAHSLSVAMGATNVSLTSGSGGDYSGYAVFVTLEYVDLA
jgi:hypothetical protein